MRTQSFISGNTAGGLLASAVLAMSMSTATHASTTIYGTPSTTVAENRYYGFQAWATDTDHRPVTYGILNKPSWAKFNTKYGHLYGVPTAANVGTYKNIVVYATDGVSSAHTAPFSIRVTGTASTGGGSGSGTGTTGAATVNWTPPTLNTNGTPLTNLAGYTINYGTSATALTHAVNVGVGLTSYTVANLPAGTYYFGVVARSSSGQQSALSNVASKTIK
jgi:hypothetical protein